MAGASASDAPGPTGPGQGKKTTSMHAGLHSSVPGLAAATMAERRSSVFKNTLISAAPRVSPTQYAISISIGTAATRKPATLLEATERKDYRSVLMASAKARRVS